MEDFIFIDNQKTYYQLYNPDKKDWDIVVLMHGWGGNMAVFEHVTSHLIKDFRVLVFDFPGFGQSQEPQHIWGVEEYTQFLRIFLGHLNLQSNPILLGHSFGGRVGINYSSKWDVRKLILVNSAGIKPKRPVSYYWKVYSYKLMKNALPKILGERRAREVIEEYHGGNATSDYLSASATMRGILSKVVNEDLTDKMPNIKCPTLLIWGDKDTATPLADAKKMESLIPDAGLVVYEGAGHHSFLDRVREFNIVLDAFLKEDLSV